MRPRFFIIMGVSGCGKTAVGSALAQKLGWAFFDADDFHPAVNIAKMASGIPLTDEDRLPWLDALHGVIVTALKENQPGVLACSALKESYRKRLLAELQDVRLVYLKGSYEIIWSRMSERMDHYMQPAMLQSQFDILEEPDDALVMEITQTVDEIVDAIIINT
ncbi:gluconokinase [bacterium]|nr:gluconokinase [bacterium]